MLPAMLPFFYMNLLMKRMSWGRMGEIQTKVLRVFFSAIHSHLYSFVLTRDFNFFKLSQILSVSTVQLLYTVKEQGGNLLDN